MLTQEALAELAQVSVRTIRNLEAGRNSSATTRRLIASALSSVLPEPSPAPAATVPAQLMPDIPAFAGRLEELRALDRHLAADTGNPATKIFLLAGVAGSGKTALAVHWAHRVRRHFPDGQLFVDLHGNGPGPTRPPEDVLGGLLRALGPRTELPPTLDERAARYRTLVAGRRMLILLDDAASDEQVRPLLPGTASGLVVVTSRHRLAGLVARHGARRVPVRPLPLEAAVGLLRALIGERVDGDPEAAAALAGLCGRMPLVLRHVAEILSADPTLPLRRLELG